MDWSLFHVLNGTMRGEDRSQDLVEAFNAWGIFALVVTAAVLWFLANPGGSLRPKLATLSAVSSAGVGLIVNAVAGRFWYHNRPFVDHPHQTVLLVHHGANNSFPSDHATVAFAVAFAVLFFYRRLGVLLVIGAVAVAISRILVGVHYPIDVIASAFIGLGAAALIATLGRPYVTWVARQMSRISDPVMAKVRRLPQ
jgi:membrane-associated phospholipid phosphatase